MRGNLTDEVKAKSLELLGYEIDKTELRLMPYVQYRLMNHTELDMAHMNGDDREVLKRWKERGFLEGGVSSESLAVTKEFWNIILEIIWIAYPVQMGNAI